MRIPDSPEGYGPEKRRRTEVSVGPDSTEDWPDSTPVVFGQTTNTTVKISSYLKKHRNRLTPLSINDADSSRINADLILESP